HIIATVPARGALSGVNFGTLRCVRHLQCSRGSNRRRFVMKKVLPMLAVAAATVVATSAYAAPPRAPEQRAAQGAEVGVGVAGGTAVGLGVSEGWWGATAAGAALPATAAGAAAVGGVAGVGGIALLDAAFQPCRGFQALLTISHGQCVNGQYVGYHEAPPPRRMYRR